MRCSNWRSGTQVTSPRQPVQRGDWPSPQLQGVDRMNPTESANYENMLGAARSGGNQGRITNDLLREILQVLTTKIEGSRAAVLSEWTDRDMTVGNVIYKAGSV